MREIELPDGKIAEFDDNTPDEVLHSFARGYIDNNLNQKLPEQQQGPDLADKINNNLAVKALAGVYDFAAGLPQGLGNKFIGTTQTATNALGGENTDFAKNLAGEVGKLKERQSQLPTSERAGIVGGEIAADIALSRGKNLLQSGGIAGLTTMTDDPTNMARIEEIGKNAALAYGVGKGFEYGGKAIGAAKEGVKNIYSGIKARAPEELELVHKAIKEKASKLYQQVRDSGTSLRPSAVGQIVKNLEDSLTKDGEKLADHLHGDTIKTIQFIKDDIANKNNDISLPELDQYRQLLNSTIKKNTTKLEGANPDAVKSIVAKDQLDRIVTTLRPSYLVQEGDSNAVKILNEAREEWGRAAKFERIATLVEKAEGNPNRIKTILKNFVTNKQNLKGYSEDVIEALKTASKSSTGDKAMKMLGGFGIDANNKLLPLLGGGGAFMAGGPLGSGATIAVGTAARQAQKYLARGKLENALKLIESSGNPAQVIAKIPNRKSQEKILQHLLKGAALTTTELNN